MVVAVLLFVASAVVVPLALAELGQWYPWLADRVVRWSARRLGDPEVCRRYEEEWSANLNEVPGQLSRLVAALGYLASVRRMRRSLRQTARVPAAQDDPPVVALPRPGYAPTAVRMLVGAELRRLRERRGLTRAEAGHPIRASEAKIIRMEMGRVGFKERDVAGLLTHYGVRDEAEREAVLARMREANARGEWHPYTDGTPNWLQSYLDLEATATLIRTYDAQFIPGPLQTEEYAREVVRLGHGSAPEEEIGSRVRLRLERQRLVLHRPDPPTVWAVVDEAALRRPVGGSKVMRDQLEALIGIVTRTPSVRLMVVPLAAWGHSAAGGSFTILRFPHQDLPDLVHLEQLTSAIYLDKREDVERYIDAMNRLTLKAAPPQRTEDILGRIIHDLDASCP